MPPAARASDPGLHGSRRTRRSVIANGATLSHRVALPPMRTEPFVCAKISGELPAGLRPKPALSEARAKRGDRAAAGHEAEWLTPQGRLDRGVAHKRADQLSWAQGLVFLCEGA